MDRPGSKSRSPTSWAGSQHDFTVGRAGPSPRLGNSLERVLRLTYGEVPQIGAETGTRTPVAVEYFKSRPGVKVFHRRVTEEGWVPQEWTFFLAPVADGIDMLLAVKTEDIGLPEFYGVQQCFRLTGVSNETWRQKYARTPAFSEFDLWQAAAAEAEKVSLTWALRNGSLQRLPALKETIGCRTPYGEELDTRRSGGHLETMAAIGPYNARMLWTASSGLILRTSRDGKWSTGLYWERTTHVSNHHPADCLHVILNIGGIAPHAQRILRGKIYWMPGSSDTLVEHWRKDFPDSR